MKLETAPPITEKAFQTQVIELAKIYRWRVYHPFLSKWSERGFPDLTMVRAEDRRLIFAELKRESGKLTDAQHEWIGLLAAVATGRYAVPPGESINRWPTVEVYVWRPSDWDVIAQILR